MSSRLLLIALFLVLISTPPIYGDDNGIYVVTTYPFLQDIMDIVLEGVGEADSVLMPGVHPSTYEFTPKDSEKIWRADFFIYVGIGSELAIGLNGEAIRDGWNSINLLRLMDDVILDDNPYFWHDPELTYIMAERIADIIVREYPDLEQKIMENLDRLYRMLSDLDRQVRIELGDLEDRRIFSIRNGLRYFADKYGLEIAGYITGYAGYYEPATSWVVSRLEEMISRGLSILFIEYEEKGTTLREVIETLADEAGIEVVGFLVIETLAPEIGVDNYFEMVMWNAELISEKLSLKKDVEISASNPYKGNPLLEPLGYNFLIRGFITLIVLMAVTSAVGSYAVIKGWSIFSDALGHGAIVGLLMAYLLLIDYYLGALIIGVVIAIMVGTLDRITTLRSDAIIAISFTTMLSIAILILSSLGGVQISLEDVLFADVTAVSTEMMYRSILSAAAIGGFIALFHRYLLLYSVDPTGAVSLGYRIGVLNYIFLGLLAITTVSAFMSIGAIPAIAALIIPPSAAYLVSRRPRTYIATSIAIGVVSGIVGYYLSYYYNVNAGAASILVSVVIFVVALAIYLIRMEPTPRHGT